MKLGLKIMLTQNLCCIDKTKQYMYHTIEYTTEFWENDWNADTTFLHLNDDLDYLGQR